MVSHPVAARPVVSWADDALAMHVWVGPEAATRLSLLAPRQAGRDVYGANLVDLAEAGPVRLPLVDVVVAGTGRRWSGRRYCESVVGNRLRYVAHRETDRGPWHEVEVDLEDPGSGLAVTVSYQILVDGGTLRSWARVANKGAAPVTVESVTSFVGGGLAGPGGDLADVDLYWAYNDWLAEARWRADNLRDALPDLNRAAHGSRSRGRFGLTSEGTWSSGSYLPMGAVANRRTGYALAWQIEHNGPWHWQVGEHDGKGTGSSYLALLGPTDVEHHCRTTLEPGGSLETVPVAVAVSHEGFEGAVGRLTWYRRALRRPHDDHRRLPVVFNDYMNTLMGDPTTERLLPLIRAAARAGAEYFCIDAGWYSDIEENWWGTVGAWLPSQTRFPNGLQEVLGVIRAEGMVPGLWLEPEVVGADSPVAETIPDEAYFRRDGQRVVEQGRFHLDLSHPAARAHLDGVVDRLVGDLGVGYLKMDYNINLAPGTEADGVAAGAGLLAHNRAFLGWVDGVLSRYPELTLESCASGGMRTDYALLSRFQLHSTSDQQDFFRYPPIAAAAPISIAPEQAAVWAYPQPEWDDDRTAFTLCSAMLGRVHLSGHLDYMTEAQQRLVAEAVATYKGIRADLARSVPFWPLGLPRWDDPWVALGMRSVAVTYLVVWRRDGAGPDPTGPGGGAGIDLPIGVTGPDALPALLYPEGGGAQFDWDRPSGVLRVRLPRSPAACLIGLKAGG